jgi:hypothetical protein
MLCLNNREHSAPIEISDAVVNGLCVVNRWFSEAEGKVPMFNWMGELPLHRTNRVIAQPHLAFCASSTSKATERELALKYF